MNPDFLGLSHNKNKWARAASFYSVSVAFTLIILKFMAFQGTGSVAILGSLVLSGIGLRGSLSAFLATRLAQRAGGDLPHRSRRGLILPAVILALCVIYVLMLAIARLIPTLPGEVALTNAGAGFAVMGISLALTLTVMIGHHIALRRARSIHIQQDKARYGRNLAADLIVILGLILTVGGGYDMADALAGLLLAVLSGRAVWNIYRHAA